MKINNWKPEVRSLLKSLTDAGCKLVQSNNGEDVMAFADGKMAEFVDHLIACDEAHLRVEMPDGQRRTLFLVLGNSPGELVCDYGVHEVLDAVTDAHSSKWEGRAQPTLEGEYGTKDGKYQFIVAGGVSMANKAIKDRLEFLRGELRAERISYAGLVELQSLADYIDSADVELLEAAGVPEAKPLSPFEQWMVKSNLERLKIEGLETIVSRLRASGYDRVADAVEKEGSAR